MKLFIYGVYTFLAAYNAGNMMSLQIQHYSLYPFVGKDNFKDYMKANNKAALVPAVLPGMLMLIFSVTLMFFRPVFMTSLEALVSLALNIVAFISTFRWQRKLQSDMVNKGYDERKIKLLLSTNWIRTIAFMLLGILTISILIIAVK
jgi:nicotinamide riboside transporter PnuC